MSFDLQALKTAVAAHHRVARIVVTATNGSAPRAPGTAMLVWSTGQDGTIGGGQLEFDATVQAREMLKHDGVWKRSHKTKALGPELGQCCGGSVTLLTECFEASSLKSTAAETEKHGVFARPLNSDQDIATARPLGVERVLTTARATGNQVELQRIDGWLVEPLVCDEAPLWIFGAGHVGRALVDVFNALPYTITWIDTAADRFPLDVSPNVDVVHAPNIGDIVSFAPPNARHLIVTYSHALDLELCHRLLLHPTSGVGLIGSKTKWARFRKRLAALGHTPAKISTITCPIGTPEIGKSPAAIAVGVAARLMLNDARDSRAFSGSAVTRQSKKETAT